MSKSPTEILERILLLIRPTEEKYPYEKLEYDHKHDVCASLQDESFLTVFERP
jgi:hypothetical protein